MDLREKIDFQDVFGVPQTVVQSEQPTPPPQVANNILKQVERQALKQLEPELAQMTQTVFTDPSFDISPGDSELWLYLFTKARGRSFELHARLFYLRSAGAVLVPSKKYGYMIKALVDPEGKKGFVSNEVYNQEKQCLDLYKNEVISLLEELRRWKDRDKTWR